MEGVRIGSAPMLRTHGLAFRYGRVEVWRDVSFSLDGGRIALLTGANGSGKSTLLRCLAGLSAPSEGAIELFGSVFKGSDRAVRRRVAFVPDVVRAVEDSALHADMQVARGLFPADAAKASDFARRRRVARRRPCLRLPDGAGGGVLVARAAVVLARQREGLAGLLMLGAVVTPFGVHAAVGAGGVGGLLLWLALLVMLPQGRLEAARVFHDDMRVRLVRDRLPFGTLPLFVLDSLPAFALVSLFSCVAVIVALPAGVSLPAALALAVLMNAATFLSSGLDAMRLGRRGWRPWSEGGLAVLTAACAVVLPMQSALAALCAVLVVCAGLAAVICRGAESAV